MDSFLHNHQAALDSQRENDAIRDILEDGVYIPIQMIKLSVWRTMKNYITNSTDDEVTVASVLHDFGYD